ncbi:MAG: polysaccharide deacetylase family protein [Lachnospiraceae bacterium]|nr:polysaccharide deacetylase family protein [Lachnospiraceae bacterium]
MTVVLLAACGSSGAQEVARNEAEPEGKTVVTLDFADLTQTDEQENSAQETENQKTEPALPESENQRGVQDTGSEEGGIAVKEKKQPPEGFTLRLDSEDWGLSFGESGTQPVGNALPEDLAWYDAYFVGDDSEKVIYLTFDCGYENGNTGAILDALKKHNVPATFFVVGHFLETAPDLVKRMVEEGHMVGNHTYHHPDMSSISSLEAFQKELDDVADSFYEITGTRLSPYYRPPQGKANAENIKMAQQLGYSTIFWSLAYVDWDTENQPSHDAAFDKLTSRIHPGAIVLLHNTSKTNGEILDELLTRWEEMGYRFVSLQQDFAPSM